MARSAILELTFPRCYFPCVPGSPQQTATTPTYAVRLDPSCALSHRVSTFFHIWFSQTKYFNSDPLISTRKKATPAPIIFTKMVTRGKPQRKELFPEEIPPRKQKAVKRAKRMATSSKIPQPPKSARELRHYRSRQHRGEKEVLLVPSKSTWKDPNLDHQRICKCKTISPA